MPASANAPASVNAQVSASGSARAERGKPIGRRGERTPGGNRGAARSREGAFDQAQSGRAAQAHSERGHQSYAGGSNARQGGGRRPRRPALGHGTIRSLFEAFMRHLFAFARCCRFPGMSRLVGWALAAALLLAVVPAANAQQLFQTPEAAAKALATAAKSGDVRAIMRVLGPDGAELASSGDPVADTATRKKFAEAYEVKNRVAVDGDKATLFLGESDWPFPIPLIRRNETWRFDAALGKEEILQRRIGRNELSAIQACLAFVDAQEEYAEKDRGAGVGAYAQRIVSRPGRKDGLYWPAQPGDESPIGERAARATAEGYRVAQGRTPFPRLLLQGPDAAGAGRPRRRDRLHRARQHDRRLRAGGLSGGV